MGSPLRPQRLLDVDFDVLAGHGKQVAVGQQLQVS
jgi:hypothetical protein